MEHREYSTSRNQYCLKCNEQFVSIVSVRDNAVVRSSPLCDTCEREVRRDSDRFKDYRKQRADMDMAKVMESERISWWQALATVRHYVVANLDSFDKELQPQAFQVISQYDWHIREDKQPTASIILMSPNIFGVGKTHLVYALARKIVETDPPCCLSKEFAIRFNPLPVRVVTEPEMMGRIRETYKRDNPETEDYVLKELTQPRVLVIDDVGKVRPRDLSFVQGIYYKIIDARYSDRQPIVLTTNLDPKQFEAHIGGACADRLIEMCGPNFVKMTGKSYRREHGI